MVAEIAPIAAAAAAAALLVQNESASSRRASTRFARSSRDLINCQSAAYSSSIPAAEGIHSLPAAMLAACSPRSVRRMATAMTHLHSGAEWWKFSSPETNLSILLMQLPVCLLVCLSSPPPRGKCQTIDTREPRHYLPWAAAAAAVALWPGRGEMSWGAI